MSAAETPDGFYAALGLGFNATADELKRGYRVMSMRYHPDRQRGSTDPETAKQRFQLVNNAFSCLSDSLQRRDYDGIFRMRCVLEQGVLTLEQLQRSALDLVYMFPVLVKKVLGVKEENVLFVCLDQGVSSARIERWRAGEMLEQRPLNSLQEVTIDSKNPTLVRMAFGTSSSWPSASSSLHVTARSATDAASISVLLRALREPMSLAIRTDDAAMPPCPRMSGWLLVKPEQAFKRSAHVYALLGRSKLLMFSDRSCASLTQLLTLEAGSLRVAYSLDSEEFELEMPSFKMSLVAESAFVAQQWAEAITEGIMSKGLFLDPSGADAMAACPPVGRKPSKAASVSDDPFECGAQASSARAQGATDAGATRGGTARGGATRGSTARAGSACACAPREGDLLGDFGASADDGDADMSTDLEELYAAPSVEIDCALGTPRSDDPMHAHVGADADTRDAGRDGIDGQLEGVGEVEDAKTADNLLLDLESEDRACTSSCSNDRGTLLSGELGVDGPSRGVEGGAVQRSCSDASACCLMDEPLLSGARIPQSASAPPLMPLGGLGGGGGGGGLDDLGSLADFGGAFGASGRVERSSQDDLMRELGVLELGVDDGCVELRLVKPNVDAPPGVELSSVEGVVHVRRVAAGSPAAVAGLRAGHVLVSVGGVRVQSASVAMGWLRRASAAITLRVRDAAPDVITKESCVLPQHERCSAAAFSSLQTSAHAPPSSSSPSSAAVPQSTASRRVRGAAAAPLRLDEDLTPSMPFAEGVSDSRIVVQWQLPIWVDAASVNHFELHWRRAKDDVWIASDASCALTVARTLLTRLDPGCAYWVRVRALSADGRVSPFRQALAEALTAPLPPEAFPGPDGGVHLSLDGVEGASRYELSWREHAPRGQPAEANWQSTEGSRSLKGLNVVKRNLTEGKRFEFRYVGITESGARSAASAPSLPVLVGDPVKHFEALEAERLTAAAGHDGARDDSRASSVGPGVHGDARGSGCADANGERGGSRCGR